MVFEGYADIMGTPAYNLRLALKRADATKEYPVELGVDRSRITTVCVGESIQFAIGTTVEAYQRNRIATLVAKLPGIIKVPPYNPPTKSPNNYPTKSPKKKTQF